MMSVLFFNNAIAWVLQRTTEDQTKGIRQTLFPAYEDLDFADEQALLYLTHHHKKEKTSRLCGLAKKICLEISQNKTEGMILNVPNPPLIRANGEDLPMTGEFTYLGNTTRHDGGAKKDIRNRLAKAINVVRMLNYVWRSQQQSTKIRRKLYPSYALSTLIYGSECWRMTEGDPYRLSFFHSLLKFCVRHSALWFARWTQQCEVVKKCGER